MSDLELVNRKRWPSSDHWIKGRNSRRVEKKRNGCGSFHSVGNEAQERRVPLLAGGNSHHCSCRWLEPGRTVLMSANTVFHTVVIFGEWLSFNAMCFIYEGQKMSGNS